MGMHEIFERLKKHVVYLQHRLRSILVKKHRLFHEKRQIEHEEKAVRHELNRTEISLRSMRRR